MRSIIMIFCFIGVYFVLSLIASCGANQKRRVVCAEIKAFVEESKIPEKGIYCELRKLNKEYCAIEIMVPMSHTDYDAEFWGVYVCTQITHILNAHEFNIDKCHIMCLVRSPYVGISGLEMHKLRGSAWYSKYTDLIEWESVNKY